MNCRQSDQRPSSSKILLKMLGNDNRGELNKCCPKLPTLDVTT